MLVLAVYVNCEPVAEQVLKTPLMAATKPLLIGNYVGRKNAYAFDGLIDEVRMYGEVLEGDAIHTEAAKGIGQ